MSHIFDKTISNLASEHGIKPLKKLGQNFIFDESLCDKIVSTAYSSEITLSDNLSSINSNIVLEVGPGPAGLTRSILKKGVDKLVVIEMDERCMPLLGSIKNFYSNLSIIHADASKIKLSSLIDNNSKIKIISNLPYNVGTLLLLNWLNEIKNIQSMTLMFQKEVAERIISAPGSKSYGRLSIITQILCNVKKCFDVSPKAFYPAPKVWSSIVHLTPIAGKEISKDVLKSLERITALAFSGRRKMLKSSLKNLNEGNESLDIVEILNKNDIDPSSRAENISPSEYLKLASYISSSITK